MNSDVKSRRYVLRTLFAAGLMLSLTCRASVAQPLVSVVTDDRPGPAAHGVEKLMNALRDKRGAGESVAYERVNSLDVARGQFLLVLGLATGNSPVTQLLNSDKIPLPHGPEAVVIHKSAWHGKPAWILAGADDRGLMYAELDVADRIGWAENLRTPLSEVRDVAEKPDAPQRAMSIYTMNRAYWESRFYDEKYWTRYLDLLAQNRFNSLVVIFGYENGGFLAPCYPYFFDVPEFPGVRMVGITAQEQERNLKALKRLIKMAHDRGINFTVGIWDHIYRGGVQGGGVPEAQRALSQPTPGLVWGVTTENLLPYTTAALTKFVRLVPEIDAIQFRMHDESGLKNTEQRQFWQAIFRVMKEHAPQMRFDARAKGLPDAVIDDGVAMGVNLRITTKYWMEQMGMPFHPTHINREDQFNRRHGYADMLRYPQQYKIHWRLWNGGPSRVLLWGDPEYARRFVASTHLYDGDGFEVNEPLCTKMEAQPHDAKPFELLNPKYRYYDYEFERYWHLFQVFGRIGYNPQTPKEVFDREFQRRFGKDAAPYLERALHRASWVLPRIVAACYPYSYFPMTRGWAEKQRLGDLPTYAKAEGSDTEQFASLDEEAKNLIEGVETAKTRPGETSRWLKKVGDEILVDIREAATSIREHRGKEFTSTIIDLAILAKLAHFHSERIPAAVNYRLFVRTNDVKALDEAIACERRAIVAWQLLVVAAGDAYADDLKFGVRGAGLCGHWRDELAALEKGLAALERERRDFRPTGAVRVAPRYSVESAIGDHDLPAVVHQPIATAPAGKPLTISAVVTDPSGVKWVRLRYRSVNQYEDYRTLPMVATGDKDHYQATIPAEHIGPKYDLMYFIEVMDNRGNGKIYPDMERETPYVIVRLKR
jgi:hypothetical protein